MNKLEKKYQKMTTTLENVSQAQAIALKKMFEYMELLGLIGASRYVSFMSDGDGDFRPKVSIEYPEELPEVSEITGFDKITGDFKIDFDSISWKIYH